MSREFLDRLATELDARGPASVVADVVAAMDDLCLRRDPVRLGRPDNNTEPYTAIERGRAVVLTIGLRAAVERYNAKVAWDG